MQEGPFCGHFSRFAEADSLSLPGETVSEALPARLSPVSKIPFLAAIWQEFGRVDNLQLSARSRHQGAVDFAGSSVRTEAEILELRGPGRIRLRRCFCVASGRLFGLALRSMCSLAIPDAVNATLVRLLRNEIESEFSADDAGEKTAHGMLLPICSSHDGCNRCACGAPQHRDDASCLVSGSAADLDDTGAARLRGAVLAAFRVAERVAVFGFDLGLVM